MDSGISLALGYTCLHSLHCCAVGYLVMDTERNMVLFQMQDSLSIIREQVGIIMLFSLSNIFCEIC